jgi:hypothetical protein
VRAGGGGGSDGGGGVVGVDTAVMRRRRVEGTGEKLVRGGGGGDGEGEGKREAHLVIHFLVCEEKAKRKEKVSLKGSRWAAREDVHH